MEKPIDFANLPLYYGHMELYIVPLLEREPQRHRNNLRLPHRDTVRVVGVESKGSHKPSKSGAVPEPATKNPNRNRKADNMEIVRKQSGTKDTLKVTPKYWLFSVRPLDNHNGAKGTQNKPHFHINLWKLFKKSKGGNNG